MYNFSISDDKYPCDLMQIEETTNTHKAAINKSLKIE